MCVCAFVCLFVILFFADWSATELFERVAMDRAPQRVMAVVEGLSGAAAAALLESLEEAAAAGVELDNEASVLEFALVRRFQYTIPLLISVHLMRFGWCVCSREGQHGLTSNSVGWRSTKT